MSFPVHRDVSTPSSYRVTPICVLCEICGYPFSCFLIRRLRGLHRFSGDGSMAISIFISVCLRLSALRNGALVVFLSIGRYRMRPISTTETGLNSGPET